MKKRTILALVLLMALILSACSTPSKAVTPPLLPAQTQAVEAASDPEATPTAITVAQLISPSDAYASMNEAILLDVRTGEEFTEIHIPGAYLIPVEEIADRAAAELPKDRTLYVYCRSGRRSALAAAELLKQGYTSVFDLGGIANWPYETEQGAFKQWDLNSVETLSADTIVQDVELLDGVELIPDDEYVELPDLCGTSDECE